MLQFSPAVVQFPSTSSSTSSSPHALIPPAAALVSRPVKPWVGVQSKGKSFTEQQLRRF